MKKRYLVALAVLCLVAAVLVGGYQWGRVRSLVEICPAVATGDYHNVTYKEDETSSPVLWDTMEEDFRRVLAAARVRKANKTKLEPSPAFELRLNDSGVGYSIIVGGDNTIMVARLDDLNGRTFWKDCDQQVFAQLKDKAVLPS